MAPPVSPPRDLAAPSVPPRDPTVPPVSPPRDPMAPLVFFPCDPMPIPVLPARNSMASPVSPPRDPAAPSVFPSLDSMAPTVSSPRDPSFPSRPDGVSRVSSARSGGASCVPSSGPGGASCIFFMRSWAAAPAPAPVLRAADHLFSRLICLHPASRRGPQLQRRYCRSCQARQSTARPVLSVPPTSVPHRAPTGPLSRFPLPESFSVLSFRSRARARGVPLPYHALSPPPPAPPLTSGPVSHLRRAPTGPSPLFSSPQPFLLPTPALSLDSGSVSRLVRKTIPCRGRS